MVQERKCSKIIDLHTTKCKTINLHALFLLSEILLTDIIYVLHTVQNVYWYSINKNLVRYSVNRKVTKFFWFKASLLGVFWFLLDGNVLGRFFMAAMLILCHCYTIVTSLIEFFSNKKPWHIYCFVMNKRVVSTEFLLIWQVKIVGKEIQDFLYFVLKI